MTDLKTTRLFHLALDVEMDPGAIAPTWEQAMTALEEMLDRAARDPQALLAALEVVADEHQPRWVAASTTKAGEILRQGRWVGVPASSVERSDLLSSAQAYEHEHLCGAIWRDARMLDTAPLTAVLESTDGNYKAAIDITSWLAQADAGEIRALQDQDWNNADMMNAIAVTLKDLGDPRASEVLNYVAWTVGRYPDIFFTMSVDPDEARAWLDTHRPGVLDADTTPEL